MRRGALEISIRLAAERGFAAMSLQDVADELGVTKQALLYHYKTKEALKLAVVDTLLERANLRLSGLVEAVRAALEGSELRAALDELEQYVDDEPHAASVMLRFLLDGDDAAVARMKLSLAPWLRRLEGDFEKARAAGVVRPELTAQMAVTQIGMLLVANFAALPLGPWERRAPRDWRRDRLRELLQAVGFVLFTDVHRPAAFGARVPSRRR